MEAEDSVAAAPEAAAVPRPAAAAAAGGSSSATGSSAMAGGRSVASGGRPGGVGPGGRPGGGFEFRPSASVSRQLVSRRLGRPLGLCRSLSPLWLVWVWRRLGLGWLWLGRLGLAGFAGGLATAGLMGMYGSPGAGVITTITIPIGLRPSAA